MTGRLRLTSFLLACAGLAIGCAVAGFWLWVLACAVLALAGWLLLRQTQTVLGSPVFLVFLVSAAVGLINGLSFWAMLATLIAGLAFWDLDAFYWRLSRVQASDETRLVEKAHGKRLALALAAGGVLSAASLLVELMLSSFEQKLSLGWAILLGLLIFISIRYGINALQSNDRPDEDAG